MARRCWRFWGETVEERFWSRVEKRGPIMPGMRTRCWIWTGPRSLGGYGRVRLTVGGPLEGTNRVALSLKLGRLLLPHEQALHRCDNPQCVRHLFTGSPRSNAVDRQQKGRGNTPRGERHGRAKITEVVVKKIRQEYKPNAVSCRALATRYRLAPMTVHRIVTRELWRHVA